MPRTASPPAGAQGSRASLIFTIYGCMFVFGLVLFLVGTLLPTLHFGYAHAGRLGSLPLIGILAASIVVGPVLDIHGAKQMLIAALILISASLALIPGLHLYWQFEICCLAYGFGGGILNTAANVLIADLHSERRARALNLLGFFFSAGAVVAPLLMSNVGGGLSSSDVLRLLAGLTGLLLIPVLFFHFPPPLQAGLRVRDLLTVLHRPLVWFFGLILIFESGNENCMFVWAGKFAADAVHARRPRAASHWRAWAPRSDSAAWEPCSGCAGWATVEPSPSRWLWFSPECSPLPALAARRP